MGCHVYSTGCERTSRPVTSYRMTSASNQHQRGLQPVSCSDVPTPSFDVAPLRMCLYVVRDSVDRCWPLIYWKASELGIGDTRTSRQMIKKRNIIHLPRSTRSLAAPSSSSTFICVEPLSTSMFASVPTCTGRRVAGAVSCRVGAKASACRFFSASADKQSFSSYEYPTRTEAPEITATAAKDFSHEQIERSTSPKIRSPDDPFDDTLQLTSEQREQRRNQTKQALGSLKLNSLPITNAVPYFVPANFPSDELEAPETHITKLDNGMRVVSQVSAAIRMLCLVCLLLTLLHVIRSISSNCRTPMAK